MIFLSRGRGASLLLAVLLLCSARLQAQPAEYGSLIDDGIREFARGNVAEARSLFERAHAISPNARTFRALGLCAFELKHYAQAVIELEASLKDPRKPLPPALADEVSETLVRTKHFIGELEVVTEPAESQLRIDGIARNGRRFALDAGDHLVVASAPGYENRSLTVAVTGMQTQRVELLLPHADVSPAAVARAESIRMDNAAAPLEPVDHGSALTTRWWFWTAIGVVVIAGVGTAVALSVSKTNPGAGSSGVTLSGQ